MVNKLKNAVWLLLGAVALFWAATTLVGIVQGGDLDPPAAPGSTMKTLDEIPPSWSQTLSASDGTSCNSSRFRCVLDSDAAVLDLETGLVWERTPSSSNASWTNGHDHCLSKTVGGRSGWRLPTMGELASLMDQTQVNPDLSLPSGHPFLGAAPNSSYTYWATTTDYSNASRAMFVLFLGPSSGQAGGFGSSLKSTSAGRWCVRGATGGYDGGH